MLRVWFEPLQELYKSHLSIWLCLLPEKAVRKRVLSTDYTCQQFPKAWKIYCRKLRSDTRRNHRFRIVRAWKRSFYWRIICTKRLFRRSRRRNNFLGRSRRITLTTQARLLRVLESGEFLKVGSSTVLKTNVRIVAATNLNMVKAVSEGKFRKICITGSARYTSKFPLRERSEDILLLFRKFSTDFAERYRMPVIQLTEDARTVLLNYRWPGNVRQLKISPNKSLFSKRTET